MKKRANKQIQIGGQALIEGVLIRAGNIIAVAAHKPNKKIVVKCWKHVPWIQKGIFKFPLLRGFAVLIETLFIGLKALNWSADQQLDKSEKIGTTSLVITLLTSLAFTIGLFVVVPFYLSKAFIATRGIVFNLVDGLFRAAIFVGYVFALGFFPNIKRVFQYHGAEHKAIACYEAGYKTTAINAKIIKKFSKEHPRCGTSFVALVLLLSIVVFSVIKAQAAFLNIATRIILLPVIAGLSYELLKISAQRIDMPLMKAFAAPGMWIQKITTKEPDLQQRKVAIVALKSALSKLK
ncbi:MAG: DUF1385 domain-containing protein [Candidatus Woesearchaeota archaeon]